MLQISIYHEGNSLKVYDAKDHTTLTTFDTTKGFIDLEPIRPYVGQRICLAHYNKHGDAIVFDYEQHKLLTKVDKDSNDMWFFEYE